MALYGIPIILKEGTKTESGNRALSQNISAIRAISEAVKTTFGPNGLNKMLVDSIGEVTVTNDCFTILDELDVEHPAAKMAIELAKTIHKDAGDGITKSLIFAGELLKIGQELLEQQIHPNLIVKGFDKALTQAIKIIDETAIQINIEDEEKLNSAANTALQSKSNRVSAKTISEIAVQAVLNICEKRGDLNYVDLDLIQIMKKEGASLDETVAVDGLIIDKEIVNDSMPKIIKSAKIALLNAPLEVTKTEFDTDIQITDANQIDEFKKQEEKMIQNLTDKLNEIGANVVFCQKGIDDIAQHFLARNGIMAIRRVKRSDLTKLMKATHAKISVDIKSMSSEDLGEAEFVEEKTVGQDKMVFVEKCKEPKSISVLIRGGTRHIIEEAERSLDNAFNVVKDLVEEPYIVPGAGAIEIEIAKRLRKLTDTMSTKESVVIEGFAAALESIPITLANNSGLDPLDLISDLHAKHEESSGINMGIDLDNGNLMDALKRGIIEPASILKKALTAASELSGMIYRVDKVIAVAPSSSGPQMPDPNMDLD